MHIAEEDTKFGLDKDELQLLVNSDEFKSMKNIRIKGLMGMATFTDNEKQVRREFASLSIIYEDLKGKLPNIDTLSMGMSGDYTIAIDQGSNMVRIGSSIFGERNY